MDAKDPEVLAKPKRGKRVGKKPAKKTTPPSVVGGDIEAVIQKECTLYRRQICKFVKSQINAFRRKSDCTRTSNNTGRGRRIAKPKESAVLPAETAQ